MADFEFLSSDSEDDAPAALPPPSSKQAKGSAKGLPKKGAMADDSSDEEMELSMDFSAVGTNSTIGALQDSGVQSWDFKSAIALLAKNDSTGIARMEVEDLIKAKRKELKAQEDSNDKGGEREEDLESEGEGEVEDEADSSGEEASDAESESTNESEVDDDASDDASGSDDDSSDSDDDDDDDDESDSDDDIDDENNEDLDKDEIKQTTKDVVEQVSDDENDASDDDDDDDDDDDAKDSDAEDAEELEKESAFYEAVAVPTERVLFSQLSLARPLMRGVAAMGFVAPTPVQAACIPPALANRDICASAVTGSGKTAAFLLPALQQILSFPRYPAASRCLILTPTRELAAQCLSMCLSLMRFTEIKASLIVGGAKNMPAQAVELKTRPDLIIGTPGRILDHTTNSTSFDLDDIQILILDEADRLLELGFVEEVTQIIKSCPANRQTMLFSATFGTKVDDLVALSLKKPVRVKVGRDAKRNEVEIAPRLEQEFVRIRSLNEGNREAMLLSILSRTFKEKVIVFFDTKVNAHRMMILAGLCGVKCGELHGNLTQTQRLEALEAFKDGRLQVLFCTDLAARGLDINNVQAVINFEMPNKTATYVHRVGRTARAGCGGKACTLIGEGRRHLMKEVVRDAEKKNSSGTGKKSDVKAVIRARTIPASVISHFNKKIESLEDHVKEILSAEYVARLDRQTQIEAERATNVIVHADEIKARPRKEWFVGKEERDKIKEARIKEITEAGTGSHRLTRKKKRRAEAKAEQEKYAEERRREREEEGNSNQAPKAERMNEETMKATARAKKLLEAKKRDVDPANMSLYDEHQEKLKADKMHNKRQKIKGRKAGDDGMGLFKDEQVQFTAKREPKEKSKAQREEDSNPYGFIGYDAKKSAAIARSSGPKGHHKFKSKTRHKKSKSR
jgi:ATP-dependent RNA helicase DDX27